MGQRLVLAGALACSFASAAAATPIPAAPTTLIRGTPVIQAKVDRGHTPAGHVRRPYMIFLSMGVLVGLVAAAVIGD